MDENPGSKFSTDPVTGEILVVDSLDREEHNAYLLKVVGRDGSWRADANVGINIKDKNDNAPVFDRRLPLPSLWWAGSLPGTETAPGTTPT